MSDTKAAPGTATATPPGSSRALPPVALTIAGSDSSGGAGIQADLKTFIACGVYGASVITALTAQNTTGVQAVHAVPPDFVVQQIDSVLSDLDVKAVKTGMLANAAIIEAVAAALAARPGLLPVIDPVMVATSGDSLLDPDAVATLKQRLIPLAYLLTPNLPEAAALLGTHEAATEHEMLEQARGLLALGPRAVLLKGGHGHGEFAIDVQLDASGVHVYRSRRIATHNTHGTGCTLSAAIAAELAKGRSLTTAVTEARDYLHGAMLAAVGQRLGAGAGPVDHGYRLNL